ncbi:hypothetical protein [Burkholderia ubonensis]|uniref:hypothetical protein n=1 Tax=Burkholderia ubonensis TaxID=101571 RepID=UPI0012F93BD5|nr:hypothetical protein [Burkholderia ubonensis]
MEIYAVANRIMKSLPVVIAIAIFLSGCMQGVKEQVAVPVNTGNARVATRTVADDLRDNYSNVVQNCGSATRPAFLCSGVILRITKTSPNYDPWGHSDFSKKTDAVSFSFLRKDSKFGRSPWNGKNGFIFFPYLAAPAGKVTPEVICWYPRDGATFYRDAAGEFGCRESIVPPYNFGAASKPCREQNPVIVTAEDWLRHFNSAPTRPNAYSCAFMVRDGMKEEAVRAFNEGLRVRALTQSASFGDHNELRIKVWDESRPDILPIEAFFYIDDGLSDARIDQGEYYNKSGGIFIPIVKINMPNTVNDDFEFSYNESDQAVSPGDSVENSTPSVPQASGNGGKLLKIDDYYFADEISIEVPQYSGMARGQTVGIKWAGRVTYNSPIDTVGEPGKMTFKVPRTEVIDSIGRTVPVTFSVKRGDTAPIESSRALDLVIEAQAIALPPPTVNVSTRKVTVDFAGMQVGVHKIRVRFVGKETRDTDAVPVTTSGAQNFDIPAEWFNENSGRTVAINYAVGTTSGARYMFSQVVRVAM